MIDNQASDVYLSDVSEKDKPWDKYGHAKSKASQLYRLVANENEGSRFWKWADRMDKCSSLLEFVLKSNNSGECKFKLHHSEFCRCPRCCTCQWRKSLKWRGRFINAIPQIMAGCPNQRFIFLTLTVKNCDIEDLKSIIGQMNRGWKLLTKSKEFPAVGFVKSLEVTRNHKTDQAHPHFHSLLMVPEDYFRGTRYISQKRWTELWQRSLKTEYSPRVDVRAIRDRNGNNQGRAALENAVLETIKYAVKAKDIFGDLDLDKYGDVLDTSKNWHRAVWFMELTDQMYKLRTISLGGAFREYLKEEELEDEDDLVHVGEDDDADEVTEDDLHLFFGWKSLVKRYTKVEPRYEFT